MGKKNTKEKKRKYIYPLPDRTVRYSRKKHMEPVPEVGKRYHCFDDGKVRPSRHFIIQVNEILGYIQIRKKYPELFEQYIKRVRQSYWLFSTHSDKFIITNGENNTLGLYVRTKQGGWFGVGDWWNSATLDVTGKYWNWVVENIDLWDYSDEEKENFIKENTI